MKNINGKTALITGASSGIGFEMAKILAAKGVNLVLAARRRENLEELKNQIGKLHPVKTLIIPIDLSLPESPKELYRQTAGPGIAVDILINNAGYGIHRNFFDTPSEQSEAMLNLLMNSLMKITYLYGKEMVARKTGYILNVGSTGAFQPTPTYAAYAAAKSFVLNFSVALNHELKETGVSVSVLCPGVTLTEFQRVAGHKNTSWFMKLTRMTADKVARKAIKGMFRRKPVIITGGFNRINAYMVRLFPIPLAGSIAASAMGKPEN